MIFHAYLTKHRKQGGISFYHHHSLHDRNQAFTLYTKKNLTRDDPYRRRLLLRPITNAFFLIAQLEVFLTTCTTTFGITRATPFHLHELFTDSSSLCNPPNFLLFLLPPRLSTYSCLRPVPSHRATEFDSDNIAYPRRF